MRCIWKRAAVWIAFGVRRLRVSETSQRLNERVTEWEIQQFIQTRYREEGLRDRSRPDVAVNANASNPHYEPSEDSSRRSGQGDLVLIDMWAKLDQPRSVYYDITWMGFCGRRLRPKFRYDRSLPCCGMRRDRAIKCVMDAIAAGEDLRGFEVDDAARSQIVEHGFGEYFFHRTGHSIGSRSSRNGRQHGQSGDTRRAENHSVNVFSIEPGIYLPEFGVRSEVNVFVGDNGAEVTGEIQRDIVRIR